MLKVSLQMIGSYDETIEELSRQIDSCMMWFNKGGHPAKSQDQESEVFNDRETKETELHQ